MLTDFQNFYTAVKRMKFATNPIRQYPPHLKCVATLPWEIAFLWYLLNVCKKLNFQTNCILIATNFVIHPQILIFSGFKSASLSLYWLQIKFLSKSCPRRWILRWLLINTAMTSAVTKFQCHIWIAKVSK